MRMQVLAGLLAVGFCGCAEAPVLKAVKAGDLQRVQAAVSRGAIKKKSLQEAMCRAAASGRDDILKVLLENGGLVDEEGVCRCANGEPILVRTNQTPLMCAAKFGRTKTVEFLLAAGADINACTFYPYSDDGETHGSTALAFAAAQDHEDIVKILLDRGADTTISMGGSYRWSKYRTAADMARKNGHENIARLIESKPVVPKAKGGKDWGIFGGQGGGGGNAAGALHLFNQIAGFVPGLSAVTSVTGKAESGLRAAEAGRSLYQAAHPAPVAVVAAAEAAAPAASPGLSAPAAREEPPLHAAAEKGDARTLQFLLAKGADVRQKCGGGETALHHAALMGRDDAVKALLAAGADADAADDDRVTPLIAASLMGRESVVKLLLASRADANSRDKLGHSALMTTCFPAASGAASEAMTAIAADLLAAKADPNAADNDGWTPLMAASVADNAALVKELLEAKADPNARSRAEDTPLSIARKSRGEDVVALLLQAGAK